MKKLILGAVIACLLLAGCTANTPASTPGTTTAPVPTTTVPSTAVPETTAPTGTLSPTTTAPETTAPQGPVNFTFYTPDDTLDGFVEHTATIDILHPDGVLLFLIACDVVDENTTVNSAVKEGTQLNLDLSHHFYDQLVTMGTTGEKMLIGCVVNTFLSAYDCETVMLTVDGQVMDSGHVVYDFPLSFFE